MADEVEAPPVATPPAPGGKEMMSVNVKGNAEDVMRRLGGPTPTSTTAHPPSKEKDRSEALAAALDDINNIFSVKRVDPDDWGAYTGLMKEVHSGECPTSYREIVEHVTKRNGGRKYHIVVLNGGTGKKVAADKFTVDADPIVQVDPAMRELERAFMHQPQQRRNSLELATDSIEKQTEMALKQAELERAQQALDSVKNRVKGPAPESLSANAALEQRLNSLELKLVEERANARVAVLEAELRAAKAAQSVAPAKDTNQEMMLQFMKDSREQFNALLAKMQDDKLNAVIAELKEIRNAPTKTDDDFFEKLLKFKKVSSLFNGDDDDDDGEPKEWWEAPLKEGVTRLFDLLEGKKREGKPMTKAELMAEMDREVDAALAKKGAHLIAPPPVAQPNALPAPVQPPPPIHQGATVVPPPVVANPVAVPAPVAAPSIPPPVVAAPEQPAPPALAMPKTVEQEISERVAAVFVIIEREAKIRPRDYQWNAIAWDTLPQDFMETLVTVAEPSGMPAVFANVASQKMVVEMTELLSQPKTAAFVKLGLDELKEWVAKAKEDPNFDPFSDDEEVPE